MSGAFVVVSGGRCSRVTTAAEARFAKLVNATEESHEGMGEVPGSLYVGSCGEAVQWAGCHVGFVINASDRSYYQWHEYCVRFWMNVNFKDALDGVTWEQRLSSVLWLALTALALGDNVLIHCRQGKHRSGILAMLIMSILARPGSEDWIWHFLLTPNQQ